MRFVALFGLVTSAVAFGACGSGATSGSAPATTPEDGDSGTGTLLLDDSGAATQGDGAVNASADAGARSDASTTSSDSGTGGQLPQTIFTVLFENHDYAEIVGNSDAPYFNSLIAKYGLATDYNDSGVHPSLPNYLTMISGAPQYPGLVDLNPIVPPFPVKQANLGTQMQSAGIAWRAYQEGMGTACRLSASGNYAPKHDPFLYFDDIQNGANGLCASTSVDYSQLAGDLTSGAVRFSFITPNLVDDGHNPTSDPRAALKVSDTWAATEIEKIIASPAYQNGGVIFITWDEAEGRNGDSASQIPMIVVSEHLKSKGYRTATKYSHKSYLATIEDLLGLPRLATVTSEPSMLEFFQ